MRELVGDDVVTVKGKGMKRLRGGLGRQTMSIQVPKLPFVSNWWILGRSAAVRSQTLMRPSWVVLVRYCPSSERATAQISPAFVLSVDIR